MVKEKRISIASPLGDLSYQPDHVYRDGDMPDTMPNYLILCVKVLPGANRAELIKPWMGPNTCLVLIENGLDIERELAVHSLITRSSAVWHLLLPAALNPE